MVTVFKASCSDCNISSTVEQCIMTLVECFCGMECDIPCCLDSRTIGLGLGRIDRERTIRENVGILCFEGMGFECGAIALYVALVCIEGLGYSGVKGAFGDQVALNT